jgi:hypothetical protein
LWLQPAAIGSATSANATSTRDRTRTTLRT